MNVSLILPAFFAGLLTFLAPCTLPLVPGYLAFISGANFDEPRAKRKILINGLAFVAGFSIIFVLFGTLAGLLGSQLVPYRIWLTRLAGVFVIIFGLFMLNVIKIPFLEKSTQSLQATAAFKRGKTFNSLLLGAAFGTGWTPCVGPILGSILLLASASTTALQGGILLLIFSLGLAIPFLIIAAGIGQASQYIGKINKYLKYVSVIGGIFLIGLGILLLTNNFVLLISKGFELLRFINYDAIVDHL